MTKFEVGDTVRSGQEFWGVVGKVGKKYALERTVEHIGYAPSGYAPSNNWTEIIRVVRGAWRIKKVEL